ncbi:HAMP domain-containing protein [Hymenobacter setariae]|uniref:histidine kinase n=1 Tax=Hymenobacter setariae TaxID=2594794 RepID=A0A558BL99_9BACT|nr:ATP-binding protein [Hymenobacter setariae]TVT37287.1 HAMP domain-containing protein [Hymenobacter setariae]
MLATTPASLPLSLLRHLRLTVKTKIWMTVTTIVLLFSFFVLFYLPAIQERTLLNNFNKDVQNHANTVALGVKIAMTEQNFQGVQTAMDFVKQDPLLRFVSLIQIDTIWNTNHTSYKQVKNIFKTYPDKKKVDVNVASNDSVVVKHASINTPTMQGEIVLAFSTKEIIQSRKQIRATSLFFSFLVFSIGILIGFVLARNISVPILKLRDAATKVGRGDLTQQVVNKSHDEIGELGLVFNKMVTDLATARQELESRTSELITEKRKSDDLLDGLKQTLADLKATQEQLIRQEKLASVGQLTKGLVDRLLNPLSYVSNFAAVSIELLQESQELLTTDSYTTSEHSHREALALLSLTEGNIEKIQEHGSSLTRIVRSMDKLLQNKSEIFIESDINNFVETQLSNYRINMDKNYRDISLELIQDSALICAMVRILPTEMALALSNLLNNAMYALHEKALRDSSFNPKLIVETRNDGKYAAILIKDNGTGISEVEQQQLFSPFFTTKPTSKGTGLGLFLSQDIVKTHKGTISVDSEPDAYTTFTIQLPLSDAAA